MIKNYGLTDVAELPRMAAEVCSILGWGEWGTANLLLLETCAAETQMGMYPDRYKPEGFGITQFDTVGLQDTLQRTKARDKRAVKGSFGYDLDKVTPEALESDPYLCLILTRLKYKLRPESIPGTRAGRAAYWKAWWNSEEGAGTVEHYLASAEAHLGEEGLWD